jgi:hypothetical protein
VRKTSTAAPYIAVFGYTNNNPITAAIAIGEFNGITPASASAPSHFLLFVGCCVISFRDAQTERSPPSSMSAHTAVRWS